MSEDLKPCINCDTPCEILPIQLGDFFTLVYLRVCSGECMFLMAYEFLHDLYEHKNFRNSLYEMENEEDAATRKIYQDKVTEESLRMMREDFQKNPNLLSTPAPKCVIDMFQYVPQLPTNSGNTVRFTRFTKEERIEYQKKYVESQRMKLSEAENDLEKIKNEDSIK